MRDSGAVSHRQRAAVAIAVAIAGPVVAPAGSAHVRTTSGPFVLTIGWGNEPAYTDATNLVELVVRDRSGRPVAAPRGSLAVQVSFGNAHKTLALEPVAQPRGDFQAPLIPTRAGTYAFHVTGALDGHTVDVAASCSPQTFSCVTDSSEIQFPAKDPSNGALAQKLARGSSDDDGSGDDGTLAAVAIVVAVLALGAALVALARGRRA